MRELFNTDDGRSVEFEWENRILPDTAWDGVTRVIAFVLTGEPTLQLGFKFQHPSWQGGTLKTFDYEHVRMTRDQAIEFAEKILSLVRGDA